MRQLHPVSFAYNGEGGTVADGRTYVGLIADEAALIMPEMVGRASRLLDAGDTQPTEIKTLDATALTYALVNAVRELSDRVTALETASA